MSPPAWCRNLSPQGTRNMFINWMIDLAFVLRAFHSKGGLHRDIKPENILLKGRHIYLSDFGLATLGPNVSGLPASVSGTERYKAPEMKTSGVYSRKADVFSLGCILLELLVMLNDIDLREFHNFRQSWGRGNCARSDDTCYRHNIPAIEYFMDNFVKKAPGFDYISQTVRQMLSPTVRSRPSADVVWKELLRGARMVEGFEKKGCCTGNPKKAGYSNASVNSLTDAFAGMSLEETKILGKELDWGKIFKRGKLFKKAPY